MTRRRSFSSKTSFIDFLLNSSMNLFVLFFFALILVNPNKKNEEGLQMKAEYIITAEWPWEIDCDVDLWVMDPKGNKSSFKNKDVGLMHLERDDLGQRNDQVSVGNTTFTVKENKEYLVIRGVLPGRYTVNLHLYSCMSGGQFVKTGEAKQAVPVTVVLQKINPTLRIFQSREVSLKRVWDEETAFSFKLDEKGFIGEFDYNVRKMIKYKDDEDL